MINRVYNLGDYCILRASGNGVPLGTVQITAFREPEPALEVVCAVDVVAVTPCVDPSTGLIDHNPGDTFTVDVNSTVWNLTKIG